MPFKNNRNSRDDKSKKKSPSYNQSKGTRINSERPAKPNNHSEEKFGGSGNDFRKGPKQQDLNSHHPSGDRSTFRAHRPENKPDKKFFGIKKPRSETPPEYSKRPLADDGYRTERSGNNPTSDPYRNKKFGERGNFPFRKDEHTRGSFRKPFTPDNKTSKPGSPYRKDDRKWSSEEKLSSGNRAKKPSSKADDGLIRLNRYIANAGICSRRKADELIEAGVVSVNGHSVSELGFKVDPFKDEVRYNGQLLKREKMVYVLLNKPKDYITTTDDPQERRTIMQLVEKASRERIYPVGRLDRNTTGLLLLTNDGDLADKLSHPKNNIIKIYQAELNKNLTQGDLNKIAFGLELEDGFIKPDEVTYVQGGSKREIGIQIHSGKNRIVRRIFEHLGYEVVKLDRVIYANLTKKDLPKGRWRYLEEKEVIQLKHLMK